MPFQKERIGPAVLRQPPQGDEGTMELKIRKDEKYRQEMVDAARDYAEGKISKEKHDNCVRHAHYRLNDNDPF